MGAPFTVSFKQQAVTFKWKDYRIKGRNRHRTMTIQTQEFIRRFLIHVLPSGFHRIRHYGLLANTVRRDQLALARESLDVPAPESDPEPSNDELPCPVYLCRSCGEPMLIVEVLEPAHPPRAPPRLNIV